MNITVEAITDELREENKGLLTTVSNMAQEILQLREQLGK